jgi:hypothetical protein
MHYATLRPDETGPQENPDHSATEAGVR